jgi:hypothetical protein
MRVRAVAFTAGLAVVGAVSAQTLQISRDAVRPATVAGSATLAGLVAVPAAVSVTPLRRARVTVEAADSSDRHTTDSDTSGRFRIEGLRPGRYWVRAAKAGFVRLGAGTADDSEPAPIDVADGASTEVTVMMEPAGAIEGRVSTESGDPAVGVVVRAVQVAPEIAGRRLATMQQTRSDDRGRYRLHTLPAGEFYVTATSDALAPYQEARAPGERAVGWAPTFYPGTAHADAARILDVGRGQDLRQIDFAVSRVPFAAVRGRIVDSTGRAVTAYAIRVQAAGSAPGEIAALVDPRSGEFHVAAVPPGEFWLLVAASVSTDAAPRLELAAHRIASTGEDLTSVTIALAPPPAVSVRVETEGRVALPRHLQLHVVETAFEMPDAPGRPRSAPAVLDSGVVEPAAIMGPALIRLANLLAPWALSRVWVDDVDVTDTPFQFQPGRAHAIRVVITTQTGVVGGVVRDARGQPARARIVLFPSDERRWGAGSRFVRGILSDATGQFAIEGLLPGDYAIAAVGDMPHEAWRDVTVLRRLLAHATAVSIGAGSRETVTLVRRARP